MNQINTEPSTQTKTNLISWGEWWEQWGDKIFDAPSVLVDVEPVCSK